MLGLKKVPPSAGDIQMWVWSLGQKDLLEEGTTTHSSILACRVPMDRGAWRATVHGVTKSQIGRMQLSMHAPTLFTKPPEIATRAWNDLFLTSDYATLQKISRLNDWKPRYNSTEIRRILIQLKYKVLIVFLWILFNSWWHLLKWSEVEVTQSYPTLCDPMDYTAHGIL